MKKHWKKAAVLALTGAMVLGGTGIAAAEIPEDVSLEMVYDMAQRALDVNAIQNVMTRHVMYHCYGEHEEEMEELWVKEPENQATATFAQNQGYYVGYQAIWEAYVDGHTENWLTAAKKYCDEKNIDVSGWTDEQIVEVYGGVGQLLLHCTTTACIEIAEDGQTAKAFWYSPGLVKETGQTGSTIWEAYGVDFVKEGSEWKIWHLHMYTDFVGSFYITLGGNGSGGGMGGGQPAGEAPAGGESAEGESPEGQAPDGESPEGESPEQEAPVSEAADPNAQQEWVPEGGEQVALENATANEYLSRKTYTELSDNRLRSEMELIIPVPYESWSFDEANYGPTAEDYANYGIDLDAWYAAH